MVVLIEKNMLSIKARNKQTIAFFLKGKAQTLAGTKKAEVYSEPYQTFKKELFRGVGRAARSASALRLFGFCHCQSSKGFFPKYYALSNWI